LDAVELRIALIDFFTVLVLKRLSPEASQSMYHSNQNKTAEKMAGETSWHRRGTLLARSLHQSNHIQAP
jgi:hypothetical protein